VILIPIAAGGPDWASIMTGIGTVAVAVVAVWVALWTDRKAAQRLENERKRSDRLLKEEREHGRVLGDVRDEDGSGVLGHLR